jgi:type II secretory pathway pseudopilin PulG
MAMAAKRPRQQGFTYVGLIVLVAIIGMVTAVTVKLGALLQRRAAEEALLDVGAAFADALKSYANASLPGQRLTPSTLDELLKDPRFPTTRRHLRQIYADPMTGQAKWGLLRGLDKVGIVAVYSLSEATPIKQANFDPRFVGFDHKQRLSDWKFVATGIAAIPAPAPEGPPPQQPKEPEVPAAPIAEVGAVPKPPDMPATDAAAPANPEAPANPDTPPPDAPPVPEVPAGPKDPPAAETDPLKPPPVLPPIPKKR